MGIAGKKKKAADEVSTSAPPSSFLMVDAPTTPTSYSFSYRSSTFSARPRTVSSPPPRAKQSDELSLNSWSVLGDDHHRNKAVASGAFPASSSRTHSQSNLNEPPAMGRPRRSTSSSTSSTHFSVPKTFSISSSIGLFARRRKTAPPPTSSRKQSLAEETLGEVIEIGPDREREQRETRQDGDVNTEEAREREWLRDAAAQALGLGLGRDDPVAEARLDHDQEEDASPVTVEHTTHPYILDPIFRMPPLMTPSPPSHVSLAHSQPSHYSQPSPTTATTSVPLSDAVPPYPSPLSALTPYIQTSSPLLKYQPSVSFLALSLNRRTKQWKIRHVILTSPPPPSSLAQEFAAHSAAQEFLPSTHPDFLNIPSTNPRHSIVPQHSHLHLFKSAEPAPEELEIDRLEINEDSVVFVAEQEVAGKRDVVKVGGRDARNNPGASASASVKSTARSWHGGRIGNDAETNVEEMGRTMWLLKMSDGAEMQRWIRFIKTAVLVQRAERAGMTYQPQAGVPSMRADLDVILSLRAQGLFPNVGVPPRTSTPPYTSSTPYPTQNGSPYSTLPGPSTAPANPPSPPNPNPRYADHVGAAPSHTTSPSSLRARTYPPPSGVLANGLPSLKGLFSTSPNNSVHGHDVNGHGSRPSSPQQERDRDRDKDKDIDPIADDIASLGNRATALLNLFRSSSRASHANSHNHHPSVTTNATAMTITTTPTQTMHQHGIGTPITPVPYADETLRAKPATESSLLADWHRASGSSNAHKHISGGSLPPPPRNHRRPWTSGVDSARRRDGMFSNGSAHPDEADEATRSSREGRDSRSQNGPHTPSPPPISPLLSTPSVHGGGGGGSSVRVGRPPSAASTSSYASADRDRLSDLDRNPSRRTRTVPKMLTPPTGPPPNAPSLRAQSPSFNSPPSPILEQDYGRRNGNGRLEPSSSVGSAWGSQHPYSKRISTSSARSVNTTSTGHSFLGSKPPPPPRPPPNFAPPPAPTDQPETSAASRRSSPARESLLPRSLRLSLLPPAAPPTQSLPPRPDEPAYRHRRSSSTGEVKSTTSLYPIPGSPSPSSMNTHPPAPPPPNGPLPPTPDGGDKDRPLSKHVRYPSLTRRLRIMSSPAPAPHNETSTLVSPRRSLDPHPPPPIGEPILPHSEDMFLNMNDTPTTPAMVPPTSFLLVPSPLQPSPDDVEPTSLSPPPRRNSRTSKEIRLANVDKDKEDKEESTASPMIVLPEPQDSAVVLE